MTYAVGSTILHDDYNTFATGAATGAATDSGNINNLWGAGNNQYGFGQSGTISAVLAADVITATQWSTLTSRINSIRKHQTNQDISFTNTTGSGAASVTSGNVIYHLAELNSAISSAYTHQNTASGTTGSADAYSVIQQGSTTSNSKYLGAPPNSPGTTTFTTTFTWGSINARRYFFNAGGYLEFAFSMPNSGTAKTQSWSNLLSDLGTIRLGGLASVYTVYSGSWNTKANYYNYNIPVNTPVTWFKKFNDTGVADYNLNYVQGTVAITNSGSTITLVVNMVDDAADAVNYALPWGSEDYISNAASMTSKIYAPGADYLTNTWGVVSVSAS